MRGFARRQVELRRGNDHAHARSAVAIGGEQARGVAGLRKRHVSGEEEEEDPGTHRRRCHYTNFRGFSRSLRISLEGRCILDKPAILIAVMLAGTPLHAASAPFRLAASQFEEPLVATAATSRQEDDALLEAIQAYRKQPAEDDFRPLDAFLSDHPRSGWRVALLTNLGLSYYHYGHFSKAIDSWERAWRAGRSVTETRAKALVDRAVGELARMHARLGHSERLAALLAEIGGRPVA